MTYIQCIYEKGRRGEDALLIRVVKSSRLPAKIAAYLVSQPATLLGISLRVMFLK